MRVALKLFFNFQCQYSCRKKKSWTLRKSESPQQVSIACLPAEEPILSHGQWLNDICRFVGIRQRWATVMSLMSHHWVSWASILKHTQGPNMPHLIKSAQESSRSIEWSSSSQFWPMTQFTHRIVCALNDWIMVIYCFDQPLFRPRKYLATELAPEWEPTGVGFCCDEDDTETESKSCVTLLDCVKIYSQTIATASLCIAFPAWPMMAVREFTCADDPSSMENEETSVPKLSSRSVGMPCMCRHSFGVSHRQWVSDLGPGLMEKG